MTNLLILATTIAAHLPPWQGKGWVAVMEDDYYRIKHPAGPWLSLYVQRYPNKEQLNVCGSFSTAPGTENSFEDLCDRINHQHTQQVKGGINLNAARAPQALARDIQRRLLSLYLPLYQQGLEAKQAKLTALNEKEALLAQLAEALGIGTYSGTLICHSFGTGLPDLWGEISVNSPTSLTVKLAGLTPAQWSRILAVLRESTSPTDPPPEEGRQPPTQPNPHD